MESQLAEIKKIRAEIPKVRSVNPQATFQVAWQEQRDDLDVINTVYTSPGKIRRSDSESTIPFSPETNADLWANTLLSKLSASVSDKVTAGWADFNDAIAARGVADFKSLQSLDAKELYKALLKIKAEEKKARSKTAPAKTKAPSPAKSKAPSPAKSKAPSPAKSKAPSPAKSKAPSPAKSKAPSPAKKSVSERVTALMETLAPSSVAKLEAGGYDIVLALLSSSEKDLSELEGLGKSALLAALQAIKRADKGKTPTPKRAKTAPAKPKTPSPAKPKTPSPAKPKAPSPPKKSVSERVTALMATLAPSSVAKLEAGGYDIVPALQAVSEKELSELEGLGKSALLAALQTIKRAEKGKTPTPKRVKTAPMKKASKVVEASRAEKGRDVDTLLSVLSASVMSKVGAGGFDVASALLDLSDMAYDELTVLEKTELYAALMAIKKSVKERTKSTPVRKPAEPKKRVKTAEKDAGDVVGVHGFNVPDVVVDEYVTQSTLAVVKPGEKEANIIAAAAKKNTQMAACVAMSTTETIVTGAYNATFEQAKAAVDRGKLANSLVARTVDKSKAYSAAELKTIAGTLGVPTSLNKKDLVAQITNAIN